MNQMTWAFNMGSDVEWQFTWQNSPPEQPPLAGVREPRRPLPSAPAGAMALEFSDA